MREEGSPSGLERLTLSLAASSRRGAPEGATALRATRSLAAKTPRALQTPLVELAGYAATAASRTVSRITATSSPFSR